MAITILRRGRPDASYRALLGHTLSCPDCKSDVE